MYKKRTKRCKCYIFNIDINILICIFVAVIVFDAR